MRVDDFDFTLPESLIAHRPAQPRDASRLLWVQQHGLTEFTMASLPQLLEPGDLLVFNDTRVIPARLDGSRTGPANPIPAKVELTLHQRCPPPTPTDKPEGVFWLAFARPAKKLKAGDTIRFGDDFQAQVLNKGERGEVTLAFHMTDAEMLSKLETHGRIPLPPYIRGGIGDERDRADYQTLLATKPGAVAAPTAGLHFTPQLMAALAARGIGHVTVTLHVGAGTFLPVTADNTQDHVMHAEWGHLDADAVLRIRQTKDRGGKVVAVGTTSARLLESAAQANGELAAFNGETRIFITPGYTFRVVDRLLTNFHLPRSTLFMLVSAFSGLDTMKHAYAYAIAHGFRFYSYGDACLLEPTP